MTFNVYKFLISCAIIPLVSFSLCSARQADPSREVSQMTTRLGEWEKADWIAGTISSDETMGEIRWQAYGFAHGEGLEADVKDGLLFGIRDVGYEATVRSVTALRHAPDFVECYIRPTISQDDIKFLLAARLEISRDADFEDSEQIDLEIRRSGWNIYCVGEIPNPDKNLYFRFTFVTDKGVTQDKTKFKFLLDNITFYGYRLNAPTLSEDTNENGAYELVSDNGELHLLIKEYPIGQEGEIFAGNTDWTNFAAEENEIYEILPPIDGNMEYRLRAKSINGGFHSTELIATVPSREGNPANIQLPLSDFNDEELWFTLQGLKIDKPSKGTYILIKSGKAVKLTL